MINYLQSFLGLAGDKLRLRYHEKSFQDVVVMDAQLASFRNDCTAGLCVHMWTGSTEGFAAVVDISSRGVVAAIAGLQRRLRDGRRYAHSVGNRANSEDGPRLIAGAPNGSGRCSELCHAAEIVRRMDDNCVGSWRDEWQVTWRLVEIAEKRTICGTDDTRAAASSRNTTLSLTVRPRHEAYAASYRLIRSGTPTSLVGGDNLGTWLGEALRTASQMSRADAASVSGRIDAVLDPTLVSLVCHEAIGHTFEADTMSALSPKRVGTRLAPEFVSVRDSGVINTAQPANLADVPFDDEGVFKGTTSLVENGQLVGLLHSRKTAKSNEVEATGNARAWSYADRPLVRMTNTYMVPGERPLAEVLAEIADGYVILGARTGSADRHGNFVCHFDAMQRIQNGKRGSLLRGGKITGNAFAVLKTIRAVTREFEWAQGMSLCEKGQKAVVGGGGPWIRCQVNVG